MLGQALLALGLAMVSLSPQPTVAATALVSTGDGSWVWQNPLPQGSSINAISCPTASVCFAVTAQTILRTSDTGSHWTAAPSGLPNNVGPDPDLTAISCASATTCLAVAHTWLVRTDNGGASWSAKDLASFDTLELHGISCPTSLVCYAVGKHTFGGAEILTTTDGGASWQRQVANSDRELFGVSCVSASICVAVGGTVQNPSMGTQDTRIILKTSNGGSTWSTEDANSGVLLNGVSCPTPDTCFAAGVNPRGGSILKSTDGGQAWSSQNTVGGNSISCPSAGVCHVLNSVSSAPGTILATNDGGGTWTNQNSGVPGKQGNIFRSVTCPDTSSCFVVGDLGWILHTSSGGATWTLLTQGLTADLFGAACPGESQCYAVGVAGTILATTDGGTSWSAQLSGTTSDLTSIDCVSAPICIAVGRTLALTTTDGGAHWTSHPFQFGNPGDSPPQVSCPTSLVCYVVGDVLQGTSLAGTVFATRDGGATWIPVYTTSQTYQPNARVSVLMGISCPGPSTCFATGQGIVRTTDGGITWTEVMPPAQEAQLIPSCPTLSICYATWGGAVLRTADGGNSWSNSILPRIPNSVIGRIGYIGADSFSCPNATTCYGVGTVSLISQALFGVGTADGGASWTFNEAQAVDTQVRQIACATSRSCIAVGANGTILSLTSPVSRGPDMGRPWTGGSDAVGTASATTDAYFAEGYTGANFEEYLTVENPGAAQPLTVDYLLADGTVRTKTYALRATSRTTILVNDEIGEGLEVSMHLHAANPIVAERPIYFSYPGNITGGHDAVGASSLSRTFYFAEGYTGVGFNEYLSLMNPGSVAANVTVTYLFNQGIAPKAVLHTVAAHSRATISVNGAAEAGSGREVSVQLNSDQPIVAERPMYFNYFGETGGSDVVGATALLTDMNLAEGHVGQGFDEYLTILNPNPQPATATITYYLGSGQPVAPVQVTLVPTSRTTIHVNNVLPNGADSSVHVHSTLPILVERPMYFTFMGRSGGHDAVAVPDSAVSTTQMFAEGLVSPNFAEYYTIMNSNSTAAHVTIAYFDENGASHPKSITVPPQSRWTEFANNDLPAYTPNSATISSDVPILAERSMYFGY